MTGEGYSVAIKNNNNNNKTLYSIHQKASISVTVFPREALKRYASLNFPKNYSAHSIL